MEHLEFDTKEYTLLLVDDIPSNILLLQAILKKEGYQIITANGGLDAIEKTKNNRPDLILLDVMMPDMNGFEVANKLKQSPSEAQIPIIFLTALNGSKDIVQGFKSGGNDFISKPFNKEELLIRVSHQISLVAARRMILSKTKELEATIKARDKMYSVIAHDLRGPMGQIKMVLNTLLASISQETIGPELFELVTMSNQTTEELFALLDNLLKWTKSQIGRMNVVYQEMNISEIATEVINVFEMIAKIKDIRIELVSKDVPLVKGDIDMTKTIFRNLISNAIKFSNKGDTITISLEERENMVIVNVIDQGCGIPEEQQNKLLHSETHFTTYGTNNEEGSGLGLLLCQDFAHKNGGKLWFSSIQGEGSTFSFSIPITA